MPRYEALLRTVSASPDSNGIHRIDSILPGIALCSGSAHADRWASFLLIGAGSLLRGFQGSHLLRQPPGTISGVVVVRGGRGGRAHEQSCETHPALGRAVAEERLRLPQCSAVPVRGADADRDPNLAVAETSGAG